jgi:tetratricopeptide (TPR) repeat protein
LIAGILATNFALRLRNPAQLQQSGYEEEALQANQGPEKQEQEEVPVGRPGDLAQQVLAPPLTVDSLKKEELELAGQLMADLPGSSDAVALKALVHESYGDSAEAVQCWEKALELNPNRADAYDAMGWFCLQKEEYEEAVGLFRKALEVNSAMPGVHNNLAGALVNLGRPEEAVEVLAEAIEIFPRPAQSRFMLGQVCLQLREYETAKQNFEIALEIQPGHRNACYGLATAYARLGQRDKSEECMERFKNMSARDLDARIQRNRAFDDLASMRRAVAQTHTNAGRVYLAQGDLAKARQHWQRAVILDPANTACRRALAQLEQMGK